MNSLLPIDLASPYGKTERCAKFSIDTAGDVFVLPDVMTIGETYTLSFWACLCEESTSNSKKYVVIDKTSFELTNEWTRFTDTFIASGTVLTWRFSETCECAIFNPKLERGDKATDWTPATEDMATGNDLSAAETALDQKISSVDAKLKILEGSIASLVRGPDGGSLVKQTDDGLYFLFDLSEIEQALNDSGKKLDDIEGLVVNDRKEIDVLNSSVEALQKVTEYIRSGVVDGSPYIELGDETAFKVLITNTQIKFMDGATAPAYISNKKLYIERAQVKDELQVGDETDAGMEGIFVWKVRTNGNMGLTWRPKELLTEEVVANG